MASSSLPALGAADPALLVPPKMPETGVADSLYYNRETATWRFETDDGAEMEFDAAKGAWVPVVRATTGRLLLGRSDVHRSSTTTF
jgi:hypothetical protein